MQSVNIDKLLQIIGAQEVELQILRQQVKELQDALKTCQDDHSGQDAKATVGAKV